MKLEWIPMFQAVPSELFTDRASAKGGSKEFAVIHLM